MNVTRLKADIMKLARRHKPLAVVIFVVHEEGNEALVGGSSHQVVTVMRRLYQRMLVDFNTINERLGNDPVTSDTVERVLNELTPAASDALEAGESSS